MNEQKIIEIAKKFYPDGEEYSIHPLHTGHINDTFVVACGCPKLVIQRINKNVFKRPEDVMENICKITEHIRAKLEKCCGDVENGVLSFITVGDVPYVIDDRGEYWRAYHFIDGDCLQTCDSEDIFTQVGVSFGKFQQQLSDFDASELHETIADFHNTEVRYANFERAVEEDTVNRASSVQAEINFVRERKAECSHIVRGIKEGRFPLRVTHNDTKLNNIIVDKETGVGLCVIDLDTVMPGSMLYDFGDAIRFGASSAVEDETDLSKVYIKPNMFEAFVKGFIEGLDGSATTEEILAFPLSSKIITLEIGMRFLTDYLCGDTYFRTAYSQHNLDRARNQFKLVESIEDNMSVLDNIVKKYI